MSKVQDHITDMLKPPEELIKMDKVLKNIKDYVDLSLVTLSGLTSSIHSIISTSDNSAIFTGLKDSTIIIWDGCNGGELNQLHGHTGTIKTLSLSVDEKFLISGCEANILNIWDWKNGSQIKELSGHTGSIKCSIVLSTNILISGSEDCSVKLWDLKTFKLVVSLECENAVFAMAATNNSSTLFTGGKNGNITIWGLRDYKLESKVEYNSGAIQTIAMSKDDRLLIFGTSDHLIKIISWPEKIEYFEFKNHSNQIWSLIATKDNYLISLSKDAKVKIFDIGLKKEIASFTDGKGYSFSLHMSNDERFLYYGSPEGLIKREIGFQSKFITFKGHSAAVTSIAISSDSNYIISGSEDSSIRMWSVANGEETACFTDTDDIVKCVCLSNDMKYFAGSTGDGVILVYDFVKLAFIGELKYCHEESAIIHNKKFAVNVIAFDNLCKLIASGSDNKLITLFNVQTMEFMFILAGHYDPITSLIFSTDDTELYSGSVDCDIIIWNLVEKSLIKTLNITSSEIKSMDFNVDFSILAIGDADGQVIMWDIKEDMLLKRFTKKNEFINSISFSGDGTLVASTSDDRAIEIYDSNNRCRLIELKGHTSTVNCVKFAKNGEYLASCSRDKTIKLWSLKNPETLCNWGHENQLSLLPLLLNPGNIKELDEKLCKLLISPLRINLAHIFAFTSRPNTLKVALELGSRIIPDASGSSPMTYAIERNSISCINAILNYLIGLNKNENTYEEFVESCYVLRKDFLGIVKSQSYLLPQFLSIIIISSTQEDLPISAAPAAKLPLIIYSDTAKINPMIFLFKDDTNRAKEIKVSFKHSIFPIDYRPGSRGSLQFLLALRASQSLEIYRADFVRYLVMLKWTQYRITVLTNSAIGWSVLAMMVILMIDPSNYTLMIIYEIFSLWGSVIQIYLLVLTMSNNYFSFWNIIRLVSSTISYIWGITISATGNEHDKTLLTFIMVVCNSIKCLSYFRNFNSTRFYVQLIIRAIIDATPFLLIFFYTTFCFGLLYWTSDTDFRADNFVAFWKLPFELNLGNFTNSGSPDLNFLYFMLAAVINVIIILNLLISILGNSYDRFQTEALEISTREQIEIMIESELIMIMTRKNTEKKYILVCEEEEGSGGNEEWMGRLKAISEMIRKANLNNMKKYEALENSNALMMKGIKGIYEKLDVLEKKIK